MRFQDFFLGGRQRHILESPRRLEYHEQETIKVGKVDLGEKLSCSSCGARYYDLNKKPALCPKCGAENERPKVFKTKKTEVPKPQAEEKKSDKPEADDVDEIEDLDTDDDDTLISDDDDLDDDDDDVGTVLGPIETDEGTVS